MHLISFFFVLVSISCGQALNIRQIDRVVDVSQNSQVQPIEWYRGESVQFNAYLWRINDQLVLPSTAQPILKAWRTNDLNTLYINVTGTLINAGQGEVRVTLTPAQANLPSGAYSFAYQIWDGTNYMGIGAQGQLRVIWSPAGDSIAYVGSSTINDFIPKPTNVWSNGWILASSTGGTTTFARAEQSITQLVAKAGSTMSGDLDWTNSGLTSLDFATFDAAPAGAISARRIQWNDSRSTLKLGLNSTVNLDVGQQLFLYGKNQETNTLAKGEVVFIFGASGDNPTIKRASHTSESLSARTIGIMAESATSNNNGLVVTRGTIYNVDTSTFTQGAPLYLGANGTMQTNLPDAPLHGVFIGVVERVGLNNGQIYVAVNNYQELRELSDVKVNGLANGNLLSYNSTSSRWENKTISALGLATGTPIYSVAGLATGTPIYSVAGLATGTPIYSVAGLATGTPIYSIAGLATGTPIYSVAGLATGTPIYSVAGLATGTPIYAESDPVWNAQKAGYATGTPIYTVAGLATGTPIYSIAGLATGTPVYTESDPVWAGVSNSIRLGINAAQTTGSLAYALAAAAATGSPVYVELDPVWAGVSNSIRASINSAQTTGSLAYALAAAAATGTPIYSVAGLATGTPIYSIAGLATGTPIYAETDPVWNAQKSGYATGTPIYTVAGLATGTPIYSIAGLATGTPVYEVTQTGQVNTISLTQAVNGAITFRGSSVTQTGSVFNFAIGAGTITNLRSGSSRLIITNGAGPEVSFGLNVSGLATGTPVYTESDPVWAGVSNSIRSGINSASATGAAAYAIAATAYLANTPLRWSYTGDTNEFIAISPTFVSSPGYFRMTNSLIESYIDFDPFQAPNGYSMIYDSANKTWRYGVPAYASIAGNASNLNGLAASAYLLVSSLQSTSTNYARFITTTVAPTGATASGLNGELRFDATNVYMYIGSSNKWMRIPGTFSW